MEYRKGVVDELKGLQFARQFALRPQSICWFLGAGASAATGIPTGYAMIADFKKRLFCELSNIPLREVDANDPLWQQRIDDHLKRRSSMPPPGDPSEYSKTFEAVYPTPESRRAYIENAISQGNPSFAHRVIASLLTIKQIPCVFTTNFDPMIEVAATLAAQLLPGAERSLLTVAAIDSAGRAERCIRESAWPLLAKLHGDYQSVELKNTDAELKAQDLIMRRALTTACTRFGLVVVGYSGRDASVMQALYDVLKEESPYPAGLYWVTQPGRPLLPTVMKLLEAASRAGVATFTVDSHNFDELSADIADQIDLPQVLATHVFQSKTPKVVSDTPPAVREKHKFPILQCSALRVLSLPTTARRIQFISGPPPELTRARQLLRDVDVRALVAVNGRELAAFGSDADLLKAFAPVGGVLAGTVNLNPETDGWAKGLLYDALVRALCRRRPLSSRLRRKGHMLLVQKGSPAEAPEITARRETQLAGLKSAYSSALVGKVENFEYCYREGVRIRLDFACNSWWCVFEPTTYVEIPRSQPEELNDDARASLLSISAATYHALADWRRERWALRYNPKWAHILAAWSNLLSDSRSANIRVYDQKTDPGLNGEFALSMKLAWSRPSHDHDYFLRVSR